MSRTNALQKEEFWQDELLEPNYPEYAPDIWDEYFQSREHRINVLTESAFYALLEKDDKATCLELLSEALVLQTDTFQSPVIERTHGTN